MPARWHRHSLCGGGTLHCTAAAARAAAVSALGRRRRRCGHSGLRTPPVRTQPLSAPPGLTTGGQSCASCVRPADRHQCLADRNLSAAHRRSAQPHSNADSSTVHRAETGAARRSPVGRIESASDCADSAQLRTGTSCPLAASRSTDNTAFSGRTGLGQIQRTKWRIFMV